MQIRNKLTLQFTAIVAVILILFSIAVYHIAEHYRYNNFKKRLEEKALNTANLLIEVKEINLALLKNLRRNYLTSLPDEFVRVYDNKNNRVYKDDTISYTFTPADLETIRNKGKLDFAAGDRQFVGIFYKEDYVITASAKDIDGKNQIKDLRLALLIGNVLCLVIILYSGRFFAVQALKPISKIIKDVGKINETNLGLRLNEGDKKDEISMLAVTFNKMFDRIEEAFERQKRFVSNASHELRTPLTAITGEIEVILMKDRPKDQYIEVLLSVLEEAKTLTHLSNGLLQLAQTGDTKGLTVERINLYVFLDKLKEEVFKRYPQNTFTVSPDTPEKFQEVDINGSEELLKIAVINVIDNAFKFSNNTAVSLNIEITRHDIILRIIDKGIGISKAEADKIFQPFFRAENAAHITGHGIGLSLSDKIIKLHDGYMEISSDINKGTTISITLPRVE